MSRPSATIVLFSVLAASAFCHPADGITLKRVFKVGDKGVESITGKLEVGGQSAEVILKTKSEVKSIDPDGTAHLEAQQIQASFNGQDSPASDGPTKIALKATGELVSYESTEASANPKPQILTGFYYPTTDVKVGDSWTVTIKGSDKLDPADITAEMKLDGDEKIGGADTWKVEGTIKEKGTDGGSSKNTYWIDKASGRVVKEEAVLSSVEVASGVVVSGTLDIAWTYS